MAPLRLGAISLDRSGETSLPHAGSASSRSAPRVSSPGDGASAKNTSLRSSSFTPVSVIGRACRLPGAASIPALWSLLSESRCAVTKIPQDRWLHERLLHPRLHERGRSYTFAAGVLDDIWGFDPGVFGLSPREAEQMDPQQRLLCELTYEALEDAGLPPSRLAGSETGVFIGASALDYGNLRILDPAGADAYFATGNALSIISNRISYIFDLHGPSLTLDTACSSGLVALNEALAALHAGRIETAIVGGVNILSSPFGFIGFSQATMLSKTGLCQAFSAAADGYVRAEGGVVFILQKAKSASGRKSYASILASRINSDGRTSGISLPSEMHQKALLSDIYADFDAGDLAFIEAHGTGTRVGDPVEAAAIGAILGQRRRASLPIGSIKTNIGHMEAASGLAGVLKAMLALEHDELPASLHFATPNPDIDFAGLNIAVARERLALTPNGGKPRLAGINSFGFGGTNAHVVISDPEPCARLEETGLAPAFLMISAQSRAALASLAQAYAAMFQTVSVEAGRADIEIAEEGKIGGKKSSAVRAQAQDIISLANAINGQREALVERLVIPWPKGEEVGDRVDLVTKLPLGYGQGEHNEFGKGERTEPQLGIGLSQTSGDFGKHLAQSLALSLAQAAEALAAAGLEMDESISLPVTEIKQELSTQPIALPLSERITEVLPLRERVVRPLGETDIEAVSLKRGDASVLPDRFGGKIDSPAVRLAEVKISDVSASQSYADGPTKRDGQTFEFQLLDQRLDEPGIDSSQSHKPRLVETQPPSAPRLSTAIGSAEEKAAKLAFVYSGNGSQWAGMGLIAYRENLAFRSRFAALDAIFARLAGWSLTEALFAADLEARLKRTKVAQPLLYALQSSLTAALAELGLSPDVVLGHSVGEVAAAEAAGILDPEAAVKVIHYRSLHQELTQNHGGMAALIGAPEAVEALLAQAPGIEIAAENSPRGLTVSGGLAELEEMTQAARGFKVKVKRLDLAYPFHSRLMSPVEAPLLRDLNGLSLQNGHTSFVSTVTGNLLEGKTCDAAYWWQNVREKVRFMEAVKEAGRRGARIFVEIGPNPALLSHITDSLEHIGLPGRSFCVLRRKEEAADPISFCGANLIAHGAKCDPAKALGLKSGTGAADLNDAGAFYKLPHYPWQRKTYRLAETMESPSMLSPRPWHPLIGARASLDRLEWYSVLDTKLLPYLGDHVIDGQIVLPGAAFAEMALAVAAEWLETAQPGLSDLEILQPMHLGPDDSRQILCKITPQTQQIEILSRKRLSQTPYVTHAVAKIFKEPPRFENLPRQTAVPLGAESTKVEAAAIYRQAAAVGLQFGPAFRQLAFAQSIGPAKIVTNIYIELVSPAQPTEGLQAPRYGLDPARLDACFHGLILVFAQNQELPGQNQAKKAYIPVRFGAISLLKPGALIVAAELEIHQFDARSILASFTLYDPDGAVIAVLRDIRYQALTHARAPDIENLGIAERLRRATAPTAGGDEPPVNLGRLRQLAQNIETGGIALGHPEKAEAQPEHSSLFLLIEGWATAFALQLVCGLADKQADQTINETLDLDGLIAERLIPAQARAWLEVLLSALERSGLAHRQGAAFRLDRSVKLPSPQAILGSFLNGHQEAAAELLLAAAANASAEALLSGDFAGFLRPLASAVWDGFEMGGRQTQTAAQRLTEILRGSAPDWPQERALRILQLGHGPLTARALALAEAQSAHLSLYETEKRRLERARLDLTGVADLEFVESPGNLRPQAYDLVIAACSLDRLAADPLFWPALRQSLAPGAVFAAIESQPSLFSDTIFMLEALKHESPETASGIQNTGVQTLAAAGLSEVEAAKITTETGSAFFLTGQAPMARRRWTGEGSLLIVSDGDARSTETASAVATLVASSGLHVKILLDSEIGTEDLNEKPGKILFFVGEPQDHAGAVRRLADTCFRLKRCAERLSPNVAAAKPGAAKLGVKGTVLWIVTVGARVCGESSGLASKNFESKGAPARQAGAVASGVWAFSRTLANEFAHLDVRRVDLAPGLASDRIATQLHELILSQSEETEILLDKTGTFVTRFLSAAKPAAPTYLVENHGLRLERCEGKGIDKIHWADFVRPSPGQGEIEIAVEAAGLNFRDVMWGMGLLPDEILEHGFAGPGLGLECAGRVTRVGPGVKTFAPGDAVMGFAKAAFATHVVVPQTIAAKRPEGLCADMAATIPVAFLTAYYGLISCAQLRAGEWVLIHGGAGGVGLAALQIALWRGAKVIATAGSPEKRALLKALGARHVFDSRSNGFAEEVLAVTKTDKGEGVGVVLNSLAGEAMERSLACLRPFGRFVELGKRDYVSNTYIGLRPFRRNLTYFGVDLDQLLLEDPQASRKLFQSVMRLFLGGSLKPLPFRSFASFEVVDAFRLMQQSGHIGKLIVKPPVLSLASAPSVSGTGSKATAKNGLVVDPGKIHLVTGGFGGFGLATAQWLAQKGARHIVLLGRKIGSDETTLQTIANLEAQGVKIYREALDITDKTKLAALFGRFGKDWPELGGVVHAAMVLEDAAIAHLDAETFTRVLAPKVKGAENLDALTRALRLDYFILYSSATVMIGNPGQAAYVAANGFLEGLARERHRAGLPALAVGWGAIEDVGVLTRAKGVKDQLFRRSGVKGLKAQEALDLMDEAIREGFDEEGCLILASLDWATAREHLPLLRGKSMAHLGAAGTKEAATRDKLDLAGLLQTQPFETVQKRVSDEIVEEISRVLRLPREDIGRQKPLAEIGLDSLMAVELALALETRFSLETSLSASASSLTVKELAGHIIDLAKGNLSEVDQLAASLAEKHKIDPNSESAARARQISQNARGILN